MKKLSKGLTLTLVCLVFMLSFVGCQKTYTVKFNTYDKGTVASQRVKDGDLVTRPADPTHDDAIFRGWYSDSNFQIPWVFEEMQVLGNITIHAKWEEFVHINLPKNTSDDGYTVTGEKTSPYNKNYIFKVEVDIFRYDDANLKVTANDIELMSFGAPVKNTDGTVRTYTYQLHGLTTDQTITVTGLKQTLFEAKLLGNREGFDIIDVDGYSQTEIKHSEDYKFKIHLQEGYTKNDFAVYVNDKIIHAIDGVYTIENVIADVYLDVTGIIKSKYIVTIPDNQSGISGYVSFAGASEVTHGESYEFTATVEEKYSKIVLKNYLFVLIDGKEIQPTINQNGLNYTFTIAKEFVKNDIYISINTSTWHADKYAVTFPKEMIGYLLTTDTLPEEDGTYLIEYGQAITVFLDLHEGYQHCNTLILDFAGTNISSSLINGEASIIIRKDGEISIRNLKKNKYSIASANGEVGYSLQVENDQTTDGGTFVFTVQLSNSHKIEAGSQLNILYEMYNLDNKYTKENETSSTDYLPVSIQNGNTFTINNITGNVRIKITNLVVKTYDINLPSDVQGAKVLSDMPKNPNGTYSVEHGKKFYFRVELDADYSNSALEVRVYINKEEYMPATINGNILHFEVTVTSVFLAPGIEVQNVQKNEYDVTFKAVANRNGVLVYGYYENWEESGYLDEHTFVIKVVRGEELIWPVVTNLVPPKDYKLANALWVWEQDDDFINNDITVYANFVPTNYQVEYKNVVINNVNYNHEDNYNTPDKRLNYNAEMLPFILSDPERENYSFMGWYDNIDLMGDKITTLEVVKNQTLYASWALEVGEDKPYSTLQDAVDKSSAGDTILLYEGVYTRGASLPHGLVINAVGNVIFDITVENLFDSNIGQRFAIGFINTDSFGLTIRDIKMQLPASSSACGILANTASLTVQNLDITGGRYAIYAQYTNKLQITNSRFNGGVNNGNYIRLLPSSQAVVQISNCTFVSSNNTNAIHVAQGSTAQIEVFNNQFLADNNAFGSAIYVAGKQVLAISDNTFYQNGWEWLVNFDNFFTKEELLDSDLNLQLQDMFYNNTIENYDNYALNISHAHISGSEHAPQRDLMFNVYVDISQANFNTYFDILNKDIADEIFYLDRNIILSINYDLQEDKTIQSDKSLFINKNMSIDATTILKVSGSVHVHGTIFNNGTIQNTGEIIHHANSVNVGGDYLEHGDDVGLNLSTLYVTKQGNSNYSLLGTVLPTPKSLELVNNFNSNSDLYLIALKVYVGAEHAGKSASEYIVIDYNYTNETFIAPFINNYGFATVFINVDFSSQEISIKSNEEILTIATNLSIHNFCGDKVSGASHLSSQIGVNSWYQDFVKNSEQNENYDYYAHYNVRGVVSYSNEQVNDYFNNVHTGHFIAFRYYVGLQYAGWWVKENWHVDVSSSFEFLQGKLNLKKNGWAVYHEGSYYNQVDSDGYLNYLVDALVTYDKQGSNLIWINEQLHLKSFAVDFVLDGKTHYAKINTTRANDNGDIIKHESLDIYTQRLDRGVHVGNALNEGINSTHLYMQGMETITLQGNIVRAKENAKVKQLDAFMTNGNYDGSGWFLPIKAWVGLDYIGQSVNLTVTQIGGTGRYYSNKIVGSNGYVDIIIELKESEYSNEFDLSEIVINCNYNENTIYVSDLIKHNDQVANPIDINNLGLEIDTNGFSISREAGNYNLLGTVTKSQNEDIYNYYFDLTGKNAGGYFVPLHVFAGAKYMHEFANVEMTYKDSDNNYLSSETRRLFVNIKGYSGVLLDIGSLVDDEFVQAFSSVEIKFTIGEYTVSYVVYNISTN